MLLAFTKRSTPDTFAGYVSVASQDGAISPPLRVRMLPSLLLFPLSYLLLFRWPLSRLRPKRNARSDNNFVDKDKFLRSD